MSKIVAHTIVIALGLKSNDGIPVTLGRSAAIVSGMQGNPKLFPSPAPSLLQALADIKALSDAETAFKSHLGTKSVRDDKKQVVMTDMKQYHAYVQMLANADASQAQIIAEAATMTVRKPASRHK